ncbi:MAG: SOS response-associated peptidase family protein [Sphingomonadaceae bacterium]|nr:SOS response-associated peptidase family protein [Sphingomonadaceae bacterium]
MLYRLDASAAEIARHFGARAGDDPWKGGHVAPGGFAPVITAGREFVAGPRPADRRLEARLIPRFWGVPPPPSAGERASPVYSVRNVDSPFWIGNLRNSEFRCLLPATAFMEWGTARDREGKRRQHWFAPSDQRPFAFAAVWKDSEVPGFALVTCEANAVLKAVGRETMPVILPPDPRAWDTWLYSDWKRASALVAPYSSSLMRQVDR